MGTFFAAENLSVLDPVSPPAQSIRDLFWLVIAITGAIFVLVEGVLLYCVFRFRSRPGTGPAEPPQIYGSQPIEVAWTVAPALVVFVLFLIVARTIGEVRPAVEADPERQRQDDPDSVRVTVVGHQWWWEFRYPDFGFTTANELHVPVGRADEPRPGVKEYRGRTFFRLESADVIHSFWVPRLAGKTDLIPGRGNTTWFAPLAEGTYLGQCAEYCGTQHANMLLRVVAEPPEQFRRWVEAQRKPAAEAAEAAEGRALFASLNCVKCHTVRGTEAAGTFGPDLTHLMSRTTIAAGAAPNDPEGAHLYRWVADPADLKPGALMPGYKNQLGDPELRLLVAYLRTLR